MKQIAQEFPPLVSGCIRLMRLLTDVPRIQCSFSGTKYASLPIGAYDHIDGHFIVKQMRNQLVGCELNDTASRSVDETRSRNLAPFLQSSCLHKVANSS